MELSKNQYKEALLSEGILIGKSLEFLCILYYAPNSRATAPELAVALGYKNFPPINALIGNLGKRIANYYHLTKDDIKTEFTGWWQLIAKGEYTNKGFVWTLKNHLSDALIELNLPQEYESKIFPEVVSSFEELIEGKQKVVTVNTYERNSIARSLCIKYYGLCCSVCDMNFESVYGKLGASFIHVHHVVDLSIIKSEHIVDPIKNLRPVCPNCHAMLHQKKPAYLIEELKSIILKNT